MQKAQAILEYLFIGTFIVLAIILAAKVVLMPSVQRVYTSGLSGISNEASQKRNTDLKNGEGHDVSRTTYPSSTYSGDLSN
jgi:galactitol-specific phosphotransferase system IIC component